MRPSAGPHDEGMTCQLDRPLGRVTGFIGDETGRGTEPPILYYPREPRSYHGACTAGGPRCCGLPRDQSSSRAIIVMPTHVYYSMTPSNVA